MVYQIFIESFLEIPASASLGISILTILQSCNYLWINNHFNISIYLFELTKYYFFSEKYH